MNWFRQGVLERQRLPAWLGSLLFHLVVLLLIVLFFNYRSEPKTAPGERIVVGGIALESFQSDENDAGKNGSASEADASSEAAALETILDGELSVADVQTKIPEAVGQRTLSDGAGVQSVASVVQSGNLGGDAFSGRGNGSGGKTVSVFETSGKGSTFVFVFDRSGSMSELNERPIRAAKAELIRAIEQLENLHRFNIIFYNEQPNIWRTGRRMIEATDGNKENAKNFVENIVPTGGTDHFEPLIEAIRLKPDVIFFLTDGDENDALSAGQLSDLNKRNGGLSQINVIQFGLGSDKESSYLRRLAAAHRGQYKYIDMLR